MTITGENTIWYPPPMKVVFTEIRMDDGYVVALDTKGRMWFRRLRYIGTADQLREGQWQLIESPDEPGVQMSVSSGPIINVLTDVDAQ